MVFELDADLPLVGLVPDEGVFQQLVSGGTLSVILHQAALNEAEELLWPDEVLSWHVRVLHIQPNHFSKMGDTFDWEDKDEKTWPTIFWTWV